MSNTIIQYREKLCWFVLVGLIVIADQASKWLVCQQLTLYHPVPVFPFFSLYLTYNTGAAFSLFSDAAGWQRWLFTLTTAIIGVGITVWLWRLPRKQIIQAIALTLILGGAIGNLLDRVLFGYVIDFLLLHWRQWQWPVFNLADSVICIGAGLLCWQLLRKE